MAVYPSGAQLAGTMAVDLPEPEPLPLALRLLPRLDETRELPSPLPALDALLPDGWDCPRDEALELPDDDGELLPRDEVVDPLALEPLDALSEVPAAVRPVG
jgi:hypothetical protein